MHVAWQELVNSGLLTPGDYVRVTSTAAAQLFNVYPRKGVVSPALSPAHQPCCVASGWAPCAAPR